MIGSLCLPATDRPARILAHMKARCPITIVTDSFCGHLSIWQSQARSCRLVELPSLTVGLLHLAKGICRTRSVRLPRCFGSRFLRVTRSKGNAAVSIDLGSSCDSEVRKCAET